MKTLLVIAHPERAASVFAAAVAIQRSDPLHVISVLDGEAAEQIIDAQPRARARRRALDQLIADHPGAETTVVSGSEAWKTVIEAATRTRTEVIVADWADASAGALGAPLGVVLGSPPCAVVLIKGRLSEARHILLPVRGGSYGDLALRVGALLLRDTDGELTRLHVVEPGGREAELARLPEGPARPDSVWVRTVEMFGDPLEEIRTELRDHDGLILGATGRSDADPLGPIGRELFDAASAAAVVRTGAPLTVRMRSRDPLETPRDGVAPTDLSDRVDRWFVANTFASAEFAHLSRLAEAKRRQGLKVSVALPALNEEATIGPIIRTIKGHLMERHPIVDELVLIDSRSSDRTREIATAEGIPVHIHDEILPAAGARVGKGEAMWKSLHVTTGDIVVWVDTDVSNFHPKFVYGIVGPLLLHSRIQFVKAFYRRPLRSGATLEPDGGGRVTELTARPLFNLFFPELSGLIQPLSGEQGGRRSLLERMPFFTGYGVETGLLIDILQEAGLESIAQVDMRQRIHRNQSLYALSQMSFRIAQVVAKRVGHRIGHPLWEESNRALKLWAEGKDGHLRHELKSIEVEERPPMRAFRGATRG